MILKSEYLFSNFWFLKCFWFFFYSFLFLVYYTYVCVKGSGPLELELQTVFSCHMDAGNWTLVLSKSSKYTVLQSHLSSLKSEDLLIC